MQLSGLLPSQPSWRRAATASSTLLLHLVLPRPGREARFLSACIQSLCSPAHWALRQPGMYGKWARGLCPSSVSVLGRSGVLHQCGVGPVGCELQHQEKCAEEHGVMQNGRESGYRSAVLSSVPPAQWLWALPAPQYAQVGPGAPCCVWHCTSQFCSGA